MREEFLITRQGKQFVLFAGLLDEAHTRGLVGIDTDLVQVPEDANGQVAIVKATVQIEESKADAGSTEAKTYSGIGDASPANVARNILPHLIRMAETRAKARALRDAINVGVSALEEESGTDEAADNQREDRGGGRRDRRSAGSDSSPSTDTAPSNVRDLPQGDSGGQEAHRDRSADKAPKSQVDFLKTLASEWRGEKGVGRLESRIGKPLEELTRQEAETWIDRLTPKDQSQAAE